MYTFTDNNSITQNVIYLKLNAVYARHSVSELVLGIILFCQLAKNDKPKAELLLLL